MQLQIPIEVEIRGKASSTYTRETIERRLSVLNAADPDDAWEIEYLRKLLAKLPVAM